MSREIIQMALRRVREGRGSDHIGPSDAWAQQAPDMASLLGGIPFVLIGGLATRLYMQERMTLDVDVLIHADDLDLAGEALRRQGRIIDLIALDTPWLDEALRSPRRGLDGQPYIDLPWLVLLKLAASRSQDLADCSRMLGSAKPEPLEQVRAAVKRYRPYDVEDVESLIRLGRLEAGTEGASPPK